MLASVSININFEISMGKYFSNVLLPCPVNLYLKIYISICLIELRDHFANLLSFISLRINVTNKQKILSAGRYEKVLNFAKINAPNESFQIFMNSSLQILFFKCKGSHLATLI